METSNVPSPNIPSLPTCQNPPTTPTTTQNSNEEKLNRDRDRLLYRYDLLTRPQHMTSSSKLCWVGVLPLLTALKLRFVRAVTVTEVICRALDDPVQ